MTIQDLRNCARMIDEMTSIKCQIQTMEAKLYYAKHPKIDGMPKQSSSSDGSDMLIRYIDLKSQYEKLYADLAEKLKAVERSLEKLSSKERSAVRYRYLQGLSISEVAEKMAYTERQVHRILREAEYKLCQ